MLNVRVNPYLVMLLGMAPDIDILLQEYIRHRSVTHSILFWSILFVPFFIMYRRRSIPYFAAAIQHILLGDVIVASTNVFWPFRYEIGMGYSLLSVFNIAMESIGMGVAMLLILKHDRAIMARQRGNILGLIVMLPLLGSMLYLFAADDLPFLDHILEGSSRRGVLRGSYEITAAALVLHASLAIILSASILQGMRALLRLH